MKEKRTKVDTKRVRANLGLYKFNHFDDYVVDIRGNGGINAKNVKTSKPYGAAMASKHAKQWKEAIDVEMAALKNKNVLGMIPRSEMPRGGKAIKTLWVFDLKTDHLDNIVRFRARIAARGDKQRPGIDYMETFSLVARMATFRLFIAVCVQLEIPIYQGDITTAYLNAI